MKVQLTTLKFTFIYLQLQTEVCSHSIRNWCVLQYQPFSYMIYLRKIKSLISDTRMANVSFKIVTTVLLSINTLPSWGSKRSAEKKYYIHNLGAHGSIAGWGTMLQAGRSPVWVPDDVDFFNLPNPSSLTMALGSTQPLREMSTRNLPGGKKRPARRADNLATMCVLDVWKCGSLNLSQP
jgi:hypothetical protein